MEYINEVYKGKLQNSSIVKLQEQRSIYMDAIDSINNKIFGKKRKCDHKFYKVHDRSIEYICCRCGTLTINP